MSFLGSALPAVIGAVGDIAGGFLGNMFSSAAEGDAFSDNVALMRFQNELNQLILLLSKSRICHCIHSLRYIKIRGFTL